ncbi:hypothetical protein ULMS_19540 [Patiriisocius marinistellae]|uniref:Secretion system C-terminal sorting domain-containing protein n=1 Tax=Patiriisocius marinistellae TaxID=2494560 RepID=A0A5J4G1L4_9FLAO|nr:T9SS type A sorting domain-containing protein [Patiriisocius marinistellae]GEQ86446.1 hypothetical protein ULMS_19540 [Patiriisocius marinistellae]
MIKTITNFKFKVAFIFISILTSSSIYAQSNCDIYCPNDFAVVANSNGEYVVEDYFANNLVTLEECNPGAVVSQSPAPGTIMGLGEFEVTMTVTSGGETDDCDFDISVIEEQSGDCDFDCPDDQLGTTDSAGNYAIPNFATNGALVVTGNCGNFTFEQDPVAGTIVTAGIYSISLSAESEPGTSSISCGFNLTVDETLNANSFSINTFTVYPNPASNKINFSNEVENATLASLTGKIIYQTKMTNSIDVSYLDKGIYILKIENGNESLIKKIVIN